MPGAKILDFPPENSQTKQPTIRINRQTNRQTNVNTAIATAAISGATETPNSTPHVIAAATQTLVITLNFKSELPPSIFSYFIDNIVNRYNKCNQKRNIFFVRFETERVRNESYFTRYSAYRFAVFKYRHR